MGPAQVWSREWGVGSRELGKGNSARTGRAGTRAPVALFLAQPQRKINCTGHGSHSLLPTPYSLFLSAPRADPCDRLGFPTLGDRLAADGDDIPGTFVGQRQLGAEEAAQIRLRHD